MDKKRRIVESVPNYSEGTDGKVVEAIVDEIRKTPKTNIVDIQYDSDYNRAVITFVGEPEAVLQANIAASKKALELIDMTKHKGQHPRIGATDVVPFVPAQNVTIDECNELARKYAKAMAEVGVPIYFYEETATRPERRNIDNIRVGDYEGLKKTIKTNPDHKPDVGPSEFHPKGGATVTGARMPLVCLNINLGTSNVKIAKSVARRIHLSTGGLVNIKAMGTAIEGEDYVQVGISNVNFKKTPMYRQLELVRIEAARYGVPVIGTELVGPIPLEAALNSLEYYLQLVNPKHLKEENLIEYYFDF
ncbi:MAG: glutamate formimidoyltransferase [Candidatus Heimdallarchaeota archaeon]|nr:glutamate formimidoyltransferase [Candidatus Heimdallarchaeota archaeon]